MSDVALDGILTLARAAHILHWPIARVACDGTGLDTLAQGLAQGQEEDDRP